MYCIVIMPLYKGKGDKYECSNSRGISLFCVVDELYAKVMINKELGWTESSIGKEHCGIRHAGWRRHGLSVCCEAGVGKVR